MKVQIDFQYEPMEAKLVSELPSGDGWQYEPKWDGFRCIVFRENEQIELRSKNGQPLARYFPEVVEFFKRLAAPHFVLDGELIIMRGDKISFEDLLHRIHPAQSRITKLARETPAGYMAFDILETPDHTLLTNQPLRVRRKELEEFGAQFLKHRKGILISPATQDLQVARHWLTTGAPVLDGVIAKRLDLPYQSGNRKGMVKVKHKRTADCVIGGFRYGKDSDLIASLLLGLYDAAGELHYVGFCSALSSLDKRELTDQLQGLSTDVSFTVNPPGSPSRWSTERSTDWTAIEPELVCEVEYDHVTNSRFRHGTKLIRWRPDKNAKDCTLAQIE